MSKTLNDEEQIKVIVGLGNPSKEFLKTRHNVGYWFLEQLLDKFAVELKTDKKLNCEIGYFEFENDKIFLVKPLTFINDSGIVVRAVSDYYKINIESFLIVHDDIDVTVGTNKLKFKIGLIFDINIKQKIIIICMRIIQLLRAPNILNKGI